MSKKIMYSVAFVCGMTLAVALLPTFTNAQEVVGEEEATTTIEVDEEVASSTDTEIEIDEETEYTEEEIDSFFEDADEVLEEDLEGEVIVGTVIAVDGDEALIETSGGAVVRVKLGGSARFTQSGRQVSGSALGVGESVILSNADAMTETGTVSEVRSDGIVVVTTSSGQQREYDLGSTSVTRNNSDVRSSKLQEGDTITVVTDEDGEVLGATAEGDELPADEKSGFPWLWVIIVVVVIGAIWGYSSTRTA